MSYTTDFLNEARIADAISSAAKATKQQISDILAKAEAHAGLSVEEAAILLCTNEQDNVEQLFSAAHRVKEAIYGKRIVLFAPLYISNYCVNNCLYCGFRTANKDLERRALSMEEIQNEIRILLEQGHKRVLVVTGEHPKYNSLDYIKHAVQTVYETKDNACSIRRINVNAAPMSTEDFRTLKTFGIGTYQCFQETYSRDTYKIMHPSGPKANYDFRLLTMHRALEAGIDDVGMGVLYGLHDFRFETLAMIMHAQELDARFNIGPHTVSVPRLEPALNAPAALEPPAPTSNDDFKRLIAVLRLALPYTGMILSTRETSQLRDEIIPLGISQISAGSRTNPGGYQDAVVNDEHSEQFMVYDTRSLDEVIAMLAKMGLMPSMCTACYRVGRTGERFMEEAKSGHIHNFCLPNGILTFKEYLEDFATPETKALGEQIIARQIMEVDDPKVRALLDAKLKQIEQGKRDLFF